MGGYLKHYKVFENHYQFTAPEQTRNAQILDKARNSHFSTKTVSGEAQGRSAVIPSATQ
jgi:hypothetical protein